MRLNARQKLGEDSWQGCAKAMTLSPLISRRHQLVPRLNLAVHDRKPHFHAKHYLGYAEDLAARLERHRAGNGARLMEVVSAAGITWRLARTWPGDRQLERKLKNRKEAPKLCPICNPKALNRAKEKNQ